MYVYNILYMTVTHNSEVILRFIFKNYFGTNSIDFDLAHTENTRTHTKYIICKLDS